MIHEILSLLDLSHSVIPSAPNISDIIKSNSVKSQTILSFSSLVDSSACGKRLRFSPAENPIVDQDTSMVCSRNEFLDGVVFVTDVQ
jgi:hypothetical protein